MTHIKTCNGCIVTEASPELCRDSATVITTPDCQLIPWIPVCIYTRIPGTIPYLRASVCMDSYLFTLELPRRRVSPLFVTISLGGTARWLQLQPSSSWPRPTVSAFQYFRWCALTKLAVSNFLHQIYSPSKEEALQSLLMSLLTLVFWLFDAENIRRHDGCNKWWRWLQLMFREGWRGLHDSFDELVTLITLEICIEYFWNLAGTLYR